MKAAERLIGRTGDLILKGSEYFDAQIAFKSNNSIGNNIHNCILQFTLTSFSKNIEHMSKKEL